MDKLPFSPKNAIGIFDSGVGGLSVLREIRNQIPDSPIIYFGDQFHVPYGPRELEEVYSLSKVITQFLLSLGAGIIVVACNTASAAALYPLREEFPDIPFVGMEPAVKPAAEKTHTGNVGVLATPATFQGKLYNSVVERFAKNVKIYRNTCSGLVQEIEKGNFSGIETRNILENALYPMLENEIDSVVLGCTHYPFVIPLIREIVGPNVTVIDPAPAIAKQTMRILSQDVDSGTNKNQNNTILLTSGPIKEFQNFINLIEIHDVEIQEVKWSQDKSEINIVHKK
ncbi:MAG: glutamate racemase [Chloroflexi bacterium HGW-Chloroflexi-3]|nr:MAG: glutamate racemase [Chloroflexi bacterium HGW-Chloroflexi-3]